MNPSSDLINRLWRLCAVLRKDGITYPQYVAELTYLLFLKMMEETGAEKGKVPSGLRWHDLVSTDISKKLQVYKHILAGLGDQKGKADRTITRIFHGAATVLRDTKNLEMLVNAIDLIKWFSAGRDSFGDLYEGLLQKNAEETKRGAGQYFTPRVIIDVIVQLMRPQPGETVQDPAAGTGGFLIAAAKYAEQSSGPRRNGRTLHVSGMENVSDTYRLLLMNLYLHGIDAMDVLCGDTLSPEFEKLPVPNVILTNPPFGPTGGRPTRTDLDVTAAVANYQLPFVEHCIRALSAGGRAAIVVPDNLLFERGRGTSLRQLLLDRCNLHTILRLPKGIFYAQGVNTNVLFFHRSDEQTISTSAVWFYDLRTNMPIFGKTTPLNTKHFESFIKAYGSRPDGSGRRIDGGPASRFRKFTREEIRSRGDDLDISWLRDEQDEQSEDLADPEELAAAIMSHLRTALSELESIAEEVEVDAASALAAE